MAKYYRRRISRARPRRSRRVSRLTRIGYRRRFSFRRRRSTGTASSIVKLTLESQWNPYRTQTPKPGWMPFAFNPFNLNGFNDYQSVYSQFRIKKCVIKINRGPDTNLVYLVAPSRGFALTATPIAAGETTPPSHISLLPPQDEVALRQTRYQKEIMPSTTAGKVRIGFHPFTLIGGYGPQLLGNQQLYSRVWNLNRWTPMSWAQEDYPIFCYGPYIVLNDALTNANPNPITPMNMILEVYCQFKGQK